jgi:hypothetical protein
MGWLRGYNEREPITVITTGTGSTSDVTLSIPSGWDAFWSAIDALFYGIRITAADGVTPIDYEVTSFSVANRTATIEIDDAPMPGAADRAVLMWLYFAPQATATSGDTSFSPSSPLTGRIELGQPNAGNVAPARSQDPRSTTPERSFQKPAAAALAIFVDFGALLERASTPYNERPQWEEPSAGVLAVVDGTGSPVTAMFEASSMRWVQARVGGRRILMLRGIVKAGTASTAYTMYMICTTTYPGSATPVYRTLEARVGIQVINVLEG